jgi:RimJ/RimL family protein N-acetyltransferase
MVTEGTRLRPLATADLDTLSLWRQDPLVSSGSLGRPFPVTMVNEKKWFDELDASAHPTSMYWAVESTAHELLGISRLFNVNWIHRTADFGIWLGRPAWGTGHGTRATELTIQLADESFGLRQIRLSVSSINQRALKVYSALGFVEEGRQVEAVYLNGQYVDLITMRRDCHGWNSTKRGDAV